MQAFGEPDEIPPMNEMLGGMKGYGKQDLEFYLNDRFEMDFMASGANYTYHFDNYVPDGPSNVVYPVSEDPRELNNCLQKNELRNLVEVMEVDPANRCPNDYQQDPNPFMDGLSPFQRCQPREELIEESYGVDQDCQQMNIEEFVDLEKVSYVVDPPDELGPFQGYQHREEVIEESYGVDQDFQQMIIEEFVDLEKVSYVVDPPDELGPFQGYQHREEVIEESYGVDQDFQQMIIEEFVDLEKVSYVVDPPDELGPFQGYQHQEEVIEESYGVDQDFQQMIIEDLEQVAHPVSPREYLQSSQVSPQASCKVQHPLSLPKPPARYNTRKQNNNEGDHVDTATASLRKRGGGPRSAAKEMNPVQKHRKIMNDFLGTAPEVISELTQMDQCVDGYIEEMYQLHNTLVDLMQHAVPQRPYH